MLGLLRLSRHVFRVAAYVVAGIAVALLLLQVVSSDDEFAELGLVIILFASAVVLFAVAVLVGVAGEAMQARYDQARFAAHDELTAEEWEEERRRETPLLAREFGRAQKAPSEEDPPVGW